MTYRELDGTRRYEWRVRGKKSREYWNRANDNWANGGPATEATLKAIINGLSTEDQKNLELREIVILVDDRDRYVGVLILAQPIPWPSGVPHPEDC